jgi:hypothetical protein
MKWLTAALVGLIVALLPSLVFADDGNQSDDVLIRIGADVRIAPGEKVGSVIVIDGNALIDGEVQGTVFVASGNATVSGKVNGDLTVIRGDIDLLPSAHLNNVTSIRGELKRAEGVTIAGDINERDGFGFPAAVIAAFSVLFWAGISAAVVAAGLIFAAVGGRQLTQSAQAMTRDAVSAIVGVVFLWVAVPAIAGVAIVTLIGIPFGVGLLVFALPALWFIGYIVAGARLGSALVGLTGRATGDHPFAATTLGLALLQLLVLVPVLGALIVLFAGVWGAGAVAVIAYRAAGGKDFTPTLPAAGAQPQAAH